MLNVCCWNSVYRFIRSVVFVLINSSLSRMLDGFIVYFCSE